MDRGSDHHHFLKRGIANERDKERQRKERVCMMPSPFPTSISISVYIHRESDRGMEGVTITISEGKE